MLRRNLASEFVAGAYVFPGGSVDPEDREPEVEAWCDGRTDAEASDVLGVASGGLGFWVAALRECFEEAGVLLARSRRRTAGDALLDTRDPEVAARFDAYRDQVNAGTVRILDVCRAEGLVLTVGRVAYVSHWITPELAPRRYDTRFFVAVAPEGQVARHDDGETIASTWVRPAEALERFEAGEIELLPPTIENLRSLAPHTSTDEVMAWAAGVTEVPTILPIVLIEDGQVLVLRPGDEGYRQAVEAKAMSGGDPDGALAQAAREAWGRKPDGS